MSILIKGMCKEEFMRANNVDPMSHLPLCGETLTYFGNEVVELHGVRYTLVHETVPKTVPNIEQIIINPPATIIIWRDGTKTVCKSNEEYDPEVGVAMCIAKKYFGSRNQFTKAVKGAMRDFEGRTWV